MPWVTRGLREGIVTTPYPKRPDGYDEPFRSAITVVEHASESVQNQGDPANLALLCPTGAIRVGSGSSTEVRVDRGRCIVCGNCVAARPDLFSFTSDTEVARVARRALIVPPAPEEDEDLETVRSALSRRVRALRRSVHIRHVDGGSDGSEESEILALTGPIYDIQRLGMFFTASPRHADILLVSGVATAGMAAELRRTFEAMPDPKVVVAAGTDAVSGGLVGSTYASGAGIDTVLPVDVYVPGSPPSPFSLLHGLLLAVGRLAASKEPR
jgi:Ni,Fe-hydrogenase III small subunit/ferredoxin